MKFNSFLSIALLTCSLFFFACQSTKVVKTEPVKFDEFPIGCYSALTGDADMKAIKDAGFNIIHTYGSSDKSNDEFLAAAEKWGMKVMLNLNRKLVMEPDGLETMRKTVRKYKDHPALGFWYLYDEPAREITPEVLRPFYEMLKEEAPNIPVALVNCWDETWDQYSDVLDIQMVDIYPVRDQEYPTAPLQYFTTLVKQATDLGKPVIAVPQLMTWKSFPSMLGKHVDSKKLRYPNLEELRYFNFGAMTYGVYGFVGYSYWHAVRTGGDKNWWGNVCSKAYNEVREFTASVEDPTKPVTFRRAEDGNHRAAYFKGKDKDFFVFVNFWPLERKRSFCTLEGYFDKDYDLIPWGNTRNVSATIIDNKLQLNGDSQPWEVFVWQMNEKIAD